MAAIDIQGDVGPNLRIHIMYGEPVIGNIIIMMVTYGFREPGEEEAKI
jgi:hypothetical protein